MRYQIQFVNFAKYFAKKNILSDVIYLCLVLYKMYLCLHWKKTIEEQTVRISFLCVFVTNSRTQTKRNLVQPCLLQFVVRST